MATDNSANYVLLNQLGDEFAARYRAGERPSLQEYIDRYPELADDIRELFPAMVEIEQVREDHQEAAASRPRRRRRPCGSSVIFASFAKSARAAWASSTRPSRSRWGGTWP